MKKFTVNFKKPDGKAVRKMTIKVAGTLSNRNGYNAGFLNKNIKLPSPPDSMKKDIAVVQQDIGANGKKVLDYSNFSVIFNRNEKLPVYTAVNIEGPSNVIALVHESRDSDVWNTDARITVNGNTGQFGNNDYAGSGFQRGHMVRYFDPAWGKTKAAKDQAMADTFYYTNCCPQIPYYNSVVWNYLEDYYLARAVFRDDRITVFSGPLFKKAKQMNGLNVPVNFWKIIVYNKPGGKIGALGFVISHERYFDRLKTKKKMGITKLVKPSLKPGDIQRLYEKQEIVEARVKLSFIEEKSGLKFGLNNVDELKDAPPYHVELIKPVSGKGFTIKSIGQKDNKKPSMKSIVSLFKAM